MKKTLSLIMSMIMLLTCFTTLAYADNKDDDNTLKFNKDGKFTILNISDIQDGYPMNSIAKNYIIRTHKVQI